MGARKLCMLSHCEKALIVKDEYAVSRSDGSDPMKAGTG